MVLPEIRRRAAIIAYEAETNIIIHSLGGEITVAIDPDKVVIEADDNGPGMDDINQAMQEGWSTAGRLPASAYRMESSSRSVILDIADTTTATGRFACSCWTMRAATRMRSADPMLVPPNFITSRSPD